MPLVNVLWYYSSAKPESGYSAAVRGYAQKLSARLGCEAVALKSDDPQILLSKAQEHGVPRVAIGAGEAVEWPKGMAPVVLKARPYADQNGQGACMHALTFEMLENARQRAKNIWQHMQGRSLCVCVANPHWLITEGQKWADKIIEFARVNKLHNIYLSNSPRTNQMMWSEWLEELQNSMPESVNIIVNDCRSGQNLYVEAISTADAILILGSSRSMAGEAAMTTVPIYYCADDSAPFHDAQIMEVEDGRLRHFSSDIVDWRRFTPVDITQIYVEQALKEINDRMKDAA